MPYRRWGWLINITPNKGVKVAMYNQSAGITLLNVINGGIAPLYNLVGPVGDYFLGNAQQAVGGRIINNLQDSEPK